MKPASAPYPKRDAAPGGSLTVSGGEHTTASYSSEVSIGDLLVQKSNKRKVTASCEGAAKKTNIMERPNVPIKNKFDPLSDCESDENIDNSPQTPSATPRGGNKNKPPPPIVIHGKLRSHKSFVEILKGSAAKGFHVKYTSENTNVYLKDKKEFGRFKEQLEKQNIAFHTFALPEDKTHAFVLCGLEGEVETGEVIEDLQNKGLAVEKCFRMNKTKRPLYLIITKSDVTLKRLEQEFKYVLYTKIKWERYRNTKKIIQCHNCQQWGHATAHCRAVPRCVKCAGEHHSRDCRKPLEDTPKCLNCSGDHTANSVTCPEYKKKIEAMRPKRQPAFRETPTNKSFSARASDFPPLPNLPSRIPTSSS